MSMRSGKLLGITAMTLAVIGVGMVFTMSTQAAVAVPAPGTICVKLAKMGHTFNPVGTIGGVFAPTTGSITARVGSQISNGFAFSVVDFTSTGTVTGLGSVAFSLDKTRTPSTSTFIGNTSGQDSTQRINVFLNVDVNGKKYRSAGQVTLLSTSVAAFPPPSGTAYSLASKVQLLDSTGKVAFDLPVGQAATIL